MEPRPRHVATRLKLEDLLLRHGAITPKQLAQAQQEQKKWGGEIGRIMVDLGFISEQLLVRALAHERGIPTADPANDQLSEEIVKTLGVQLCERFGVIAVGGDLDKKMLRVATSNPTDTADLKQIASICGYRIEPAVATEESISKAIRKYYYGEESRLPRHLQEKVSDRGIEIGAGEGAADAAPSAKKIGELDILVARIERLEQALRPLKEQISQSLTNPHIAALSGRLEKLSKGRDSKRRARERDVPALPCRTKFSLDLRGVPFFALSFERLPKTEERPAIPRVLLQILTINAFSVARFLGIDQRRSQIMTKRIKPVCRF